MLLQVSSAAKQNSAEDLMSELQFTLRDDKDDDDCDINSYNNNSINAFQVSRIE
jgi:hypothetical protein